MPESLGPTSTRASEAKPGLILLFPDDWAGFSPTLTRLVHALDRDFEVRAFVLDTGRFPVDPLDPRLFQRIVVPTRLARWLRLSGLYRPLRMLLLARAARRHGAGSIVVAVDAPGALAATLAGRSFHALSLELTASPLGNWLIRRRARSVVIQSQERARILLGPGGHPRTFYLQNAPSLAKSGPVLARTAAVDARQPRLVYMGNVLVDHGVDAMLESLRAWPGASLTLCGPVRDAEKRRLLSRYRDLFDGGRAQLREGFVPEAGLVPFLRGFDIGICLYTLAGKKAKDVNYLTSPSGKMFNYFAAGLPVIASNHVGLDAVTRFQAGVQVQECTPRAIADAGAAILGNYAAFSEGACAAARASDFDIGCDAIVRFLRTEAPA